MSTTQPKLTLMLDEFLPFARPTISEDAIQEVVDCLRSGWITTGPRVQKFEENLRTYFGAPHALVVSSATIGLFLAMKALDFEEGSEVITTPLTFAASLNTIVQCGLRPVLVDVVPHTYNIDLNQIEAAITPKTRAIMPVHYAGLSVDLDPLYALANKHGLRVIEDAAHAMGATDKGRRIGSFGDIQVFSFHPNKNMTTGEGGVIVTRDAKLAEALEQWRFHGMDRSAFNRFSKAGSQDYDIVAPGYKANMMDLQAALGLHQLPEVDAYNERRRALAERYQARMKSWKTLTVPCGGGSPDGHAWHLYAPLVNGPTRAFVMQALKERNVGTGLHYNPVHLFTFYQKTYGFKAGDFPQAESIGARIFSLPLFPLLTDAQQDQVIDILADILGE